MLRIAICDDELKTAHELEHLIQAMPFQNLETEIFLSGNELLNHFLISDSYNIVLLDIEMPSINGIETAIKLREIDSNVILIYITAYKEYVYEIFKTLPFRFLEKPASYDNLFEVIQDALFHIEETKCYFFYKKGNTAFQIQAKDILYFEAANRKIQIHTKDGIDTYYGKFKKLMEQLNTERFLQIHTSYIVDMDYIVSFNEKTIALSNGTILPVSLKYRDSARMGHLNFLERRCGKW